MTNLTRFTRWSGLASMLGGLLFAIGIALHPLRHGEAVNASPYSAIHVLGAFGLMLILLGLVGLYVRQAEQLGTPGLLSFIVAFIGNVLTFGGLLSEGFLWPAIGLYDPAAVHNFDPNAVAARGSSLLPLIFFVGLALFALGYSLFGHATMRRYPAALGRYVDRDWRRGLCRRRFFAPAAWCCVATGDNHRDERCDPLRPGFPLARICPVERRHQRAAHRAEDGFGSFEAAARFCPAADEVRHYFRYRKRLGETVPLAEQRRVFRQRWDALQAGLLAA
jgi:hypothetical protein